MTTAVVEILKVSVPEAQAEQLWGYKVIASAAGNEAVWGTLICAPGQLSVPDNNALRVKGYVVSRSSRAVAVEAVYEGVVIQTAPIQVSHASKAARFPQEAEAEACGFRMVIEVRELAAEFELVLQAVLEGGSRTPLGVITGVYHRVGAVTEILKVSVPEAQPEQLWGYKIIASAAGNEAVLANQIYAPAPRELSEYALPIKGYVVSRDSRVVAVEAVSEGVVIQTAPVQSPPAKMVAMYPPVPGSQTCGFRMVVEVRELAAEFELVLQAVLESGNRTSLGVITGVHRCVGAGDRLEERAQVNSPSPPHAVGVDAAMLGSSAKGKALGNEPETTSHPVINKAQSLGPIAVSGVGGSGTRVVAMMLKELGIYLGSNLNQSSDNLLLGLLLISRERSIEKPKREDVFKGLRIFEKIMTGRFQLEPDEVSFTIDRAVKRFKQPSVRAAEDMIEKWLIEARGVDHSAYTGWGWKAPPCHILIDYFSEYFSDLRYIHLIRHGLDMAYSGNQRQLREWGSLFGVHMPDSPELLPQASLRYWIKSNERAIALGRQLLGDRFLVMNFDDLCFAPQREIQKLISFLKLDEGVVDLNKLCSLVKPPQSIGRYKTHDMSVFSDDEINAVRKFGFVVDRPGSSTESGSVEG